MTRVSDIANESKVARAAQMEPVEGVPSPGQSIAEPDETTALDDVVAGRPLYPAVASAAQQEEAKGELVSAGAPPARDGSTILDRLDALETREAAREAHVADLQRQITEGRRRHSELLLDHADVAAQAAALRSELDRLAALVGQPEEVQP